MKFHVRNRNNIDGLDSASSLITGVKLTTKVYSTL